MSTAQPSLRIPIASEFFCDGHYYILTSTSLGGSGLAPETVSQRLSEGSASDIKDLLDQGVCLPLFFDADGVLDGVTIFVVGELTKEEANEWIGHLSGFLKIPCGKLVLLAGGGDPDEFAHAVSGKPPEEHYEIFQVMDVPPGSYRVDLYAYLPSFSAQVFLDEEPEPIREWYIQHCPGQVSIHYLFQLTPVMGALPAPVQVPEIHWLGFFDFRPCGLSDSSDPDPGVKKRLPHQRLP